VIVFAALDDDRADHGVLVRIPTEADQRSELMAITIPK
jgi:hypothetical protein